MVKTSDWSIPGSRQKNRNRESAAKCRFLGANKGVSPIYFNKCQTLSSFDLGFHVL